MRSWSRFIGQPSSCTSCRSRTRRSSWAPRFGPPAEDVPGSVPRVRAPGFRAQVRAPRSVPGHPGQPRPATAAGPAAGRFPGSFFTPRQISESRTDRPGVPAGSLRRMKDRGSSLHGMKVANRAAPRRDRFLRWMKRIDQPGALTRACCPNPSPGEGYGGRGAIGRTPRPRCLHRVKQAHRPQARHGDRGTARRATGARHGDPGTAWRPGAWAGRPDHGMTPRAPVTTTRGTRNDHLEAPNPEPSRVRLATARPVGRQSP